ncbi:hypothetical protein CWO90_19295 [Bradyrhizobium sp. Leo121]|nr:hypothetical protein CWO90_19295 [Bradyrhizobium sp. Leo121]
MVFRSTHPGTCRYTRHDASHYGAHATVRQPRPEAVLVDGLGALVLALNVIVVLLSVFYRYALHEPIEWAEEAARVLLIAVTFVGAAAALRRDQLTGIEANTARRRYPHHSCGGREPCGAQHSARLCGERPGKSRRLPAVDVRLSRHHRRSGNDGVCLGQGSLNSHPDPRHGAVLSAVVWPWSFCFQAVRAGDWLLACWEFPPSRNSA